MKNQTNDNSPQDDAEKQPEPVQIVDDRPNYAESVVAAAEKVAAYARELGFTYANVELEHLNPRRIFHSLNALTTYHHPHDNEMAIRVSLSLSDDLLLEVHNDGLCWISDRREGPDFQPETEL
jgi:hypothetical protein